MLKKIDIVERLKTLELPKDQYCVMTGAALVLLGVKECTRDIDIGCTDELFELLLQRGYKLQQIKEHKGIIIGECIEIFRNWKAEQQVYIEDIPVAHILSIKSYKQKLGRVKDLEDIRRIDEYLAANEKAELES